MIANDLQYRVTRKWVERFADARAAVEAQPDLIADLHPRLRQALRDQYDSQLDDLRAELAEYEALRAGRIRELELRSLAELPEALIRARIASALSQKALASRLKLKEQQVQRYESTRYAGVSLDRVQAVLDALGAQLHARVVLPARPAPRSARAPGAAAARAVITPE